MRDSRTPCYRRVPPGLIRQAGQQREAREPMLAHIIAGDMRQRRGEMIVGGAPRDRALARRQQRRDAPPAPGAAEVQAVEMRDLPVAAVADDRRREQGRGLARLPMRGRNCSNQPGNRSGCVRAMHSASISAGERNSSPPGSHAWQSRSAPNQ